MMFDKKNEENEQKNNIMREIIEMVLYMLAVFLVVWLVLTFVGQRVEVSGPSMYDTLEDRDNLWVDKLTYRFQNPERFDIVIFPHEEDGKQSFYIKRIIGLPGETVRIGEDGTIYINNEPLEEAYGYETIAAYTIERAKNDILLGEDEYFVLGDNRNDSLDSRTEEVGNVKGEDLVGKAVFRIWPLSKFGKLE